MSKTDKRTKAGKAGKAEQAMQRIYDILHLDMDAEGEFYNADKEWEGADTLDMIAEAVHQWKPAPGQDDTRTED